MRIEDVVKQLQGVLPKYTDAFTDNFVVTTLTRSGTTITVVTTAVHGLSTGDFAFILGAKNPIPISLLTQAGGVAFVTTSQDHDLTLSPQEVELGRVVNIDIDGATETDYNGSHKLLSTDNRREFTYEITQLAPTPATGTPVLLQEGRGYNGWHEVTVVDTTTFTFETTETPNSPAQGTILCRLRPRISGVFSGEHVVEVYTKQAPSAIWAFVAIDDKTANKSREAMSDAISTPGAGAEYRQQVIQPFSIFCVFPSTKSIKARQQRDAADNLVLPFCKSLLRVKFPTGFSEDPFSGVVFSTDGVSFYNGAYYMHQYSFETTAWLTYGDTLDPEDSTAFRDIELNFRTTLGDVDEVQMTANVNLDDDPLP